MELQTPAQVGKSIAIGIARNRLIIFLFITLVASIAAAPSFLSSDGVWSVFSKLAAFSLSVRRGGSAFVFTFLLSLALYLVFGFAAYLCGISLSGRVFAFFTIAAYGFFFGAFDGVFYSVAGTDGLLICLAIYIIPFSVSSFALLLGCREAFTFSSMLSKAFSPKLEPMNFHSDFRLYCLRFIFVACLLAASDLLAAVLNSAFIPLFDANVALS